MTEQHCRTHLNTHSRGPQFKEDVLFLLQEGTWESIAAPQPWVITVVPIAGHQLRTELSRNSARD